MSRVRRFLTEILLEVTNSEINSVAKDVYNKAKTRGILQLILTILYHIN